MFDKRFSSLFIPLLLFIFSFLLYLHNLSPSVYGGDVGDLVTAAYVGGVPHAPGYPLFTFLGFLLTRLPFATPAFLVGLISVFSGAMSVVLFFLTVRLLTKKTGLALLSSSILACSYLFWFYNEIAEVFALHIFLLTLLFFFAISYRASKKSWMLFACATSFGLALTNHQTSVLFLPALLLLTMPTFITSSGRIKKILLAFGISIGIFVLSYCYVIVASSHHPPINWDNVHDINSFLRLLLRRDYGTFTAGSFAPSSFLQRVIIIKSYLFTLLTQLTIPVIAVSSIGFIVLLWKDKWLLSALIVGFILSGPLFVGYAGFPLTGTFLFGVNERFFSMSALMILYAFPFGLLGLIKLFQKFGRPQYGFLLQVVFCIVPLMLFFYNFPKTNLSHEWIGDNLGVDILSSLPRNTVLLMGGDTALFNTWYMHYAMHVRPDVQIVNLNGFGDDPYMKKEQQLFTKTHPQVKDPEDVVIQTLAFIAQKRPVAAAKQLEGGKGKLTWVPLGLVYQMVPEGSKTPTQEEFLKQSTMVWQKLHLPTRTSSETLGSLTISEIPSIYSNALLSTGAFINNTYHDTAAAHLYYQKALLVDSDNAKAHVVMGLYNLTTQKDCSAAIVNLTRAMSEDQFYPITYFLLYTAYHNCAHDDTHAATIVKEYEERFHMDFFAGAKKALDTKSL